MAGMLPTLSAVCRDAAPVMMVRAAKAAKRRIGSLDPRVTKARG